MFCLNAITANQKYTRTKNILGKDRKHLAKKKMFWDKRGKNCYFK